MKKVVISLAIAALCFCSCCNNNNSKQSEGEEAAVEAVADTTKACCGKCAEGEQCENCNERVLFHGAVYCKEGR